MRIDRGQERENSDRTFILVSRVSVACRALTSPPYSRMKL